MPNKHFYLNTPLTITEKDDSDSDTLRISGYASTNDKDRDGDVIEASAWEKPSALKDYLNNPIILAYHDHKQPIGKMVEYTVSPKGLHIVAEISKAAGDVFSLIKDGILSTFSVGFRIKDADWDSKADLFRIKEVELFETSVVSVPANASATFSVGKSFDSEDEYRVFKQQFETIKEDDHMDPKVKQPEAKPSLSAEEVAAIVAKSLEARDKKQAEEKAAAEATATLVSGAVKDATDLLQEEMDAAIEKASSTEADLAATIQELTDKVGEQGEALKAAAKNKMRYNGEGEDAISKKDADNAILLGLAMNKDIEKTKFGKELIEKSGGQHLPSTTGGGNANLFWEEQFATGILAELQDELKVSPLFSSFPMPSSTYKLPINPRNAVEAAWITTANQRGANSTGTAADHALEDLVMVAKKLAAKTYIGYEEEEDAILPILPFIRENLVRRMAEAKDASLLLGTGSGITTAADGISGLLDFATPVELTGKFASNPAVAHAVDQADLRAMRARMGLHGLNQNELVYVVSKEVYFDLLEDTDFQTLDKVGDRATFLKGEVGMVGSVPVVVSDRFPAEANDAVCAALIYRKNYLLGELRGLMTESDKDIEEQKNIIVTTQRLAFQEIESGVGIEFIKYDADGS